MNPVNSTLAPVRDAVRLVSLDTLRGCALLGILAMNIQSYAMPSSAYFFPTSYGDMGGLNGLVWHLGDLLAESKFITIFSMLFGAGIVLMSDRAREAGRGVAALHYRRMGVLLLIGLIHAYLMWHGDILVSYALCGLLVFLFRNMRPGRILAVGIAFLIVGSALSLVFGSMVADATGEQLAEISADLVPPPEAQAAEVADMQGGFADQMKHRVAESAYMHATIFPFYMLWRAGGSMLLGMALFKWGVFSARSSRRTYLRFIALGLLVGIPLTAWGNLRNAAVDWDPVASFFVISQWGYWGSLLTALGWVGAVMLVCHSGALSPARTRLAAVGRMAFTNYLMQTVLCGLIFYGHGLGLFGQVSRVGQAGVMVAVWVLQLWWSPLWLTRFRYGPMEWLWRSLSYRRRQPFRREADA